MEQQTLFVSYSHEDQKFVEQLTNDLRTEGFQIWRDVDNLTAGTASWEKAVRGAIKASVARRVRKFHLPL